jgi:hypothetical protein
MWRLTFALGLAGCDVIFTLSSPTTGDATLPPCDHGAPLSAGRPVELQTTESVEAARFVPDRSIVYLSLCPSPDKRSCELYSGTLNEVTGEYGTFAKLEISADNEYDSYPTITPDAKYILFGSERSTFVQVFVAEEINGRFMNPKQLAIPGQAFSNEPYMVGNGRALYLSAGSDQSDNELFRGEGTPPDFDNFVKVPGVNTGEQELAPVVTDDELEIFFASNRDDVELPLDIYTATRGRTDAPFDPPVRVAPLSTSASIDWPLWISPDRCDLYYINKVGDQATLLVASRR